MTIVTDGVEKIFIDDEDFEKIETRNWYKIRKKVDYFSSSLYTIVDWQGRYIKVVKSIDDSDVDILEEYDNINYTKNKKISDSEILLSKKDFKNFKAFYKNMMKDNTIKDEAYIEAGAILLSFSIYQDFYLEKRPDADIDLCFDFVFVGELDFRKYKLEIYKRAKEILKNKYKVSDFALIFDEDIFEIE